MHGRRFMSAVRWRSVLAFACLACLFGSPFAGAGATPLRVSAAASLADVLQVLGNEFESATHQAVVFNFAGSNTLARQIDAGAPADVFFSADEATMDRLQRAGFIDTPSRRVIISNQLVVVTPSAHPISIRGVEDLASSQVRRIAIAEPSTVPAGVYAKSFLKKVRLWAALEPKLIPTEHVRAALAAVESGNADAGFVYRSDAQRARVIVAFAIAGPNAPDISYPAAVVSGTSQPATARAFLDFLLGDQAQKVFLDSGFSPVAPH